MHEALGVTLITCNVHFRPRMYGATVDAVTIVPSEICLTIDKREGNLTELSRLKRWIGLENFPYLLDEPSLYERQQGKLVFSPFVFDKILTLNGRHVHLHLIWSSCEDRCGDVAVCFMRLQPSEVQRCELQK